MATPPTPSPSAATEDTPSSSVPPTMSDQPLEPPVAAAPTEPTIIHKLPTGPNATQTPVPTADTDIDTAAISLPPLPPPLPPLPPPPPLPVVSLESLLSPFQPPATLGDNNINDPSPLALLSSVFSPRSPPPGIAAALAAAALARPKLPIFKQLSDAKAGAEKGAGDSMGNLGTWIDKWRKESMWKNMGHAVKFLAAIDMTESFFAANRSLAKRVRAMKTVKPAELDAVKKLGGDAAEKDLQEAVVAAGALVKTWVNALKSDGGSASAAAASKDKTGAKRQEGAGSSGIKRKTTAEIAAAAMAKTSMGSGITKTQADKKLKTPSSKAAKARLKNQPQITPPALSSTMMDDDLFGGGDASLKPIPRVPRKSESAAAAAAAAATAASAHAPGIAQGAPRSDSATPRTPRPSSSGDSARGKPASSSNRAPLQINVDRQQPSQKPFIVPTTPAPSALRRAKAKQKGKRPPARSGRSVKFASGRDAVHVRWIESREELATMWDESVLNVDAQGIGGNSSGATGIGGRERESENERLREQKEQRLRQIDGMKEEMMWPLTRYRVKVELPTEINMARSELYVGKELLEAEKRIQGATAVYPSDLIGHPLDPPLHEKGCTEQRNAAVPWIPLEYTAKGAVGDKDDEKTEGDGIDAGPSQALLHAAATISADAVNGPPSFNPNTDFDANLLPMLAANPALISNLDALVQMANMQYNMISTHGSGFGQDMMEMAGRATPGVPGPAFFQGGAGYMNNPMMHGVVTPNYNTGYQNRW